MQGGVVLPAQVPQRFDAPRKSRATGRAADGQVFTRFDAKSKWVWVIPFR
jgi:hypothetical protein